MRHNGQVVVNNSILENLREQGQPIPPGGAGRTPEPREQSLVQKHLPPRTAVWGGSVAGPATGGR